MSYTVDILRSAQKELGRIQREDQTRIIAAIRALATNPRPASSKKLVGRSAWRIRVGDYRVIYEIEDNILRILVIAVAHRKDVYR